MHRLEEAAGRFEPAGARGSEPSPPRRLVSALARASAALGPLLDRLRNFFVSAALIAILVVVGWTIVTEARREAIVVERIEVPRLLEEQGLRGEVLASRLLDAVAATSAAAFWRGERPSVAAGWKAGDFQVPGLGVSTGAVARLVEDLIGRPDRRVGGEVVRIDGAEVLRLRIAPPGGLEPVRVAIEPAAEEEPALDRAAAKEAALDRALARAAEALLLRLDPVALAAHRLAFRLERLPAEATGEEALAGFEAVAEAVDACLVEPSCRARDGFRARLIRATAAWRAARHLVRTEGERRAALLEDALLELEFAAPPEDPPLEAMLRRADILVDLGRTEEGWRAFAEAAARHPASAAPLRDWAKALARAGRFVDAAAKLAEAARLAPLDAWVFFELGAASRLAGREAEAIEALHRATRLDGRLYCAFEEWGRALESLGRIEAARRRLEQATRLR
ncbi:MAG: hypothetical protein RMJ04_14500, partial [Geminicoccaceae bacterium]|nr:hypothetical protein [Geminicoccaceae bacterium]